MRSIAKTMLGFVWAVLITVGVIIAIGKIRYERQKRHDARYAAEGQRAAEVFLRTNDQSISKQLGSTNDLGDFLRFDGTGFIYPVWNIQGYHFLDLHRTAQFTEGTIPMRIFVTEGRLTAPNLNTIGAPEIHNGSIFISHPDVKSK